MKNILIILIGCVIIYACEKEGIQPPTPVNPCENVICLNGGACYDGDCHCANGYSGVRCQDKKGQSGRDEDSGGSSNTDPCENVVCLNGGECDKATRRCVCPKGYSGSQCENFDACHNVSCRNGGRCINGNCDCETGWTGLDCSTKVNPQFMIINDIGLEKFPITHDDGGSWDSGSGPDPYATIDYGISSNKNSKVTGWYRDMLLPRAGHFWNMPIQTSFGSDSYKIDRLDSYWSIAFYDYDGDNLSEADYLCGIYFAPSNYAGNDVITLTSPNCKFYLFVEWEY